MAHTNYQKDDELFPVALKAIGNECPDTIYALGNLELLKSDNMVAIIGSRKASRQGNNAAYSLGAKLARRLLPSVSRTEMTLIPATAISLGRV